MTGRWGCLLLMAASACASAAAPQPRAADDVAAPVSRTGDADAPPPAPPKPRTFVERLAAVSRALDRAITPEAVSEIFDAPAEPTESPLSFRFELPNDGGTLLLKVATEESPERGVRIDRAPNLTLDDLVRLYGKRYETIRGAKEGPIVIFDATQAGWPYGLYVSARVQSAVRPRARIRSVELHYAQ